MWRGNVLGRDDPVIASGSALDTADPIGIIDGNRIDRDASPGPTAETDPMLVGGNWISADDMRAILAGDAVSGGPYFLDGEVIT